MIFNHLKYCLFTFWLLPLISTAQHPAYYTFNTENGLPTNEVYSCYESENQLLYIAHDLGVSVYDGENFKSIQPEGIAIGVSCYGIFPKNGEIWFKYASGELFRLDKKGNLIPYKYNQTLKNANLGVIYEFSFFKDELYLSQNNGALKVTSKGEIEKLTPKGNHLYIDTISNFIYRKAVEKGVYFSIEVNNKDTKEFIYPNLEARHGVELHQNKIYWNGATIFWMNNNKLHTYNSALNNNYFDVSSLQIINNELYVSSSTGLQVFEINKSNLIKKRTLFEDDYIGIISKGQSGTWVPSLKNGLYFLPNEEIKNYLTDYKIEQIISYSNNLFTLSPLSNNQIKIISDKDEIQIIDTLKFQLLKQIAHGHNIIPRKFQINNNHLTLTNKPFIFVIKEEEYELKIDPSLIEIIFGDESKKITLGKIASCIQHSDNVYVLGGGFGLKKLSIINQNATVQNIDGNLNDIVNLHKLNSTEILVTSRSTIKILDLSGNPKITTLYSNDKVTIHTALVQDSILFIGTKAYLEVIDLKSTNKMILDVSDGLGNSNIQDICIHKNKVFLGTEIGVSSIPLTLIYSKLVQNQINYNDLLEINDVDADEILIKLKYNSLNPWKKIQLKYQLNNNNEITQNGTLIQFSNLRSGEYTLKTKILIGDYEHIELDPLYFNIPSPIYSRWWFTSSIILIIAAIILLIIRRNNRIATKKLETEKLIETLRMSALTSQMNPHFLYNALNTIQGLLNGDKKLVFIYVSDLARFFRQMLNNSSELYIPVSQEVKLNQVFCQVESVRQFFDVALNIHYENEKISHYKIPSMIIQPFVENAMWHAFTKEINAPQIQINVMDESHTYFRIEIQDNGIGIENTKNKSKIHQSKGVGIVENRLKIFNSENTDIMKNIILTDRKTLNTNLNGTTVTIYLNKRI